MSDFMYPTEAELADKSRRAGERFNNPFNMWHDKYANDVGGLPGRQITQFDTPAIFPNKLLGASAAIRKMAESPLYSGKTMQDLIGTWVGHGESYAPIISQATGIPTSTKITPQFLQSPDGMRFLQAMARYETQWEKPYPLTQQDWETARQLAFDPAARQKYMLGQVAQTAAANQPAARPQVASNAPTVPAPTPAASSPSPSSTATPSEPLSVPRTGVGGLGAGSAGRGGIALPGASLAGVTPVLGEMLGGAKAEFEARNPGYTISATSGYRGGTRQSQHGLGNAIDMQIVGPDGKAIANTGNDPTGLYHQYARLVYAEQQANHPELNGKLAWGGAFGTRLGGGGPPDLMHFDLGGERGHWVMNRPSQMGALALNQAGATNMASPYSTSDEDISKDYAPTPATTGTASGGAAPAGGVARPVYGPPQRMSGKGGGMYIPVISDLIGMFTGHPTAKGGYAQPAQAGAPQHWDVTTGKWAPGPTPSPGISNVAPTPGVAAPKTPNVGPIAVGDQAITAGPGTITPLSVRDYLNSANNVNAPTGPANLADALGINSPLLNPRAPTPPQPPIGPPKPPIAGTTGTVASEPPGQYGRDWVVPFQGPPIELSKGMPTGRTWGVNGWQSAGTPATTGAAPPNAQAQPPTSITPLSVRDYLNQANNVNAPTVAAAQWPLPSLVGQGVQRSERGLRSPALMDIVNRLNPVSSANAAEATPGAAGTPSAAGLPQTGSFAERFAGAPGGPGTGQFQDPRLAAALASRQQFPGGNVPMPRPAPGLPQTPQQASGMTIAGIPLPRPRPQMPQNPPVQIPQPQTPRPNMPMPGAPGVPLPQSLPGQTGIPEVDQGSRNFNDALARMGITPPRIDNSMKFNPDYARALGMPEDEIQRRMQSQAPQAASSNERSAVAPGQPGTSPGAMPGLAAALADQVAKARANASPAAFMGPFGQASQPQTQQDLQDAMDAWRRQQQSQTQQRPDWGNFYANAF